MNEERIEQLAQTIEQVPHSRETDFLYTALDDDDEYDHDDAVLLPKAFNLRWFRAAVDDHPDEDCQTAGCIAGFCVGLFPEESRSESYTKAVASLLAIDHDVAYALCVPCDLIHDLSKVTPAQAAQAVRNVVPLMQRPTLPQGDTELERALWSHAANND